jgi:hypothetical protein
MDKPECELTGDQLDRVCGGTASGDILSLAFTVMMDATKSASADLKSIMDDIKQINAAKAQLRSIFARRHAGGS